MGTINCSGYNRCCRQCNHEVCKLQLSGNSVCQPSECNCIEYPPPRYVDWKCHNREYILYQHGSGRKGLCFTVTANQWVSYDIPLTEFSGVDLADIIQIKFTGGTGTETIYLDNIYFYKAGPLADQPKSPIDFETGGYGANWTWTVFENSTNPALEIIANPDPTGINTSATVAKFTALQAGNPWAGVESAHGAADLGPFVLDANNSIIKIMVWKPVISDVGIKLVAPTGWAQPEIKVANTVVNAWEELTFDFSAYLNPPEAEGKLDQIVVFPDFNLAGRGQDNIVYFDNITFNQGEYRTHRTYHRSPCSTGPRGI
jgi:hypothetical protein